MRRDGRQLLVEPQRRRGIVRRRNGADGDLHALRPGVALCEKQRCREGRELYGRSWASQMTGVRSGSCSTAPSWLPKSTTSSWGWLASARSVSSAATGARGGARKTAIARAGGAATAAAAG